MVLYPLLIRSNSPPPSSAVPPQGIPANNTSQSKRHSEKEENERGGLTGSAARWKTNGRNRVRPKRISHAKEMGPLKLDVCLLVERGNLGDISNSWDC